MPELPSSPRSGVRLRAGTPAPAFCLLYPRPSHLLSAAFESRPQPYSVLRVGAVPRPLPPAMDLEAAARRPSLRRAATAASVPCAPPGR